MDKYVELLKKAVTEIVHVFRRRGDHRLTTDRSAVIIPRENQINDLESFELVTWLIVR